MSDCGHQRLVGDLIEVLEARRLLAGDFQWVNTFGSSLTDVGQAIAADGAHVYVLGTFKNTIDFDPGPGSATLTSAGGADIFLAKYTRDGGLVWARRTGGSGDEIAGAVAVDAAGNVHATGAFRNTADFDPGGGSFNLASAGATDIFAWKLNSSGNFVWAARAGAAGDDAGRGVNVDGNGNVFLTGHFSNSVDFDPSASTTSLTSAGSTDALIWKLTSAGALADVRRIGGSGADVGYDLDLDADGNIFAIGDFSNTVDFNPGAGAFNLSSAGIKDVYVVKLDSAMNFSFARRMGGGGTDTGLGLALDEAGDIFAAGLFGATGDFDPGAATFNLTNKGGKDIFVSKLDAAGDLLWAHGFGSAQDDDAHDVAIDASGNAILAGSYSGTIDFDPGSGVSNLTSAGSRDNVIFKLTADGTFGFARGTGSTTGGEYTKNVALDDDGGIYSTGHFNGTIDFDPSPAATQTRVNVGWSDIFLLKLSDDPPVTQPPDAPQDLFAAPVSHQRIDLSWQDVAGEGGYKIERSPNAVDSWTEIVSVGANVTGHQDTGLDASTTYYYRVRAFNAAGDSDYTNLAWATTPGQPTVATVNIVATDANAAEAANAPGQFTISRVGDLGAELIVNYTISGSAGNGGDYQTISSTAIIPAGTSWVQVNVLPIDDALTENTETVVLTLSAGDYVIGDASASVSIADNDQPVVSQNGLTGQYFDEQDLSNLKLTRIDPTVNFIWLKGSPDPSIGIDTFSARWTGFVQPEFSQNYRFYVDANNGVRLWVNDQLIINRWTNAWGEISGTINLQAGQKYPIKLEFFEYDNNANVKLSWSSSSRAKQVIPTNRLFTNVEPPKPQVTIAASDAAASENPGDGASFVVTRTGDIAAALTVHYTIGGSALNGTDYSTLSGSVVIPAGSNTANIDIAVVDDPEVEGSENIVLTVTENPAYTIGAASSAGATIADNDVNPFNTRPNTPVILEPEYNGFVVSAEDLHMVTDLFSDPDPNDVRTASDWEVWTTGPNPQRVWAAINVLAPEGLHVHFGDGVFQGVLAGQSRLEFDTDYQVRVRHRDSSSDAATEWSDWAQMTVHTAPQTPTIPQSPDWVVDQAGYVVEVLPLTFAPGQGEFRLPVNIEFVPNPGNHPSDPLFYVTELYGSIRVVTRNFTVHTYATNLLNYNPSGPISGSGEQGLAGIVVEPVTGDLFVTMLYDDDPNDGIARRYAKVTRLVSSDDGLSMVSQQDILLMAAEQSGPSHQVSNISIGPDGKLWVHNGEGLNYPQSAVDLNSFRGKILRMNFDGTPVAPSFPGDLNGNPFYDASNGITARDYIWSYGLRNPFGGAWRASDGQHYFVENGPSSNDRLGKATRGFNFTWNGTAASMTAGAIYNWATPVAPVNAAFIQPSTFGGSGFPSSDYDHLFVTESGPTYATGPQSRGKRITEFVLDGNGSLVSGPTSLAHYAGDGKATAVALAAGPDGLYFSDLYEDDPIGGSFIPTAAGANILRIRYVGT